MILKTHSGKKLVTSQMLEVFPFASITHVVRMISNIILLSFWAFELQVIGVGCNCRYCAGNWRMSVHTSLPLDLVQ